MKSFSELVDYNALFTQLAQRGIVFSDEDKEKLKTICTEELNRFDGNGVFGGSLTGGISNFVYMFFSLIQNIFSGFDTNNIGSSLTNAADLAGNKGDLHMLNEATIRIYQRFQHEGGSFARAAELVSGQKITASASDGAPADMDDSIYRQIRKTIPLPEGTSAALNRHG